MCVYIYTHTHTHTHSNMSSLRTEIKYTFLPDKNVLLESHKLFSLFTSLRQINYSFCTTFHVCFHKPSTVAAKAIYSPPTP